MRSFPMNKSRQSRRVRRVQVLHSHLTIAALAMLVGCPDEHPAADPADTDGIVTAAETAADETGTGPGVGYQGCLEEPIDGLSGVRFQCDVEYDFNVRFELSPAVGSSPPLGESFTVSTLNDGSYEHPIVMACCEPVDELPADSCTMPHQSACMEDLIVHICRTAGDVIKAESDGLLPGGGALVVEAAGGEIRDRINDCFDHFWRGGDEFCDLEDLCSADFCDVAHDSFFHHPVWTANGLTVSQGGSTVSNIEIELVSFFGADAVELPPDPAAICDGPNENDGLPAPSTAPGTIGDFRSPVSDVAIHVFGPMWDEKVITGSGHFDDTSVIHRHVDTTGKLILDEWIMLEAEPTVIGTSAIEAEVDGFQLQLVHREELTKTSGTWTAGAGTVLFNLSATVDGQGSGVLAYNSTNLKFFESSGGKGQCPSSVAKCFVSQAFEIGYEDSSGGTWTLEVPTITWVP